MVLYEKSDFDKLFLMCGAETKTNTKSDGGILPTWTETNCLLAHSRVPQHRKRDRGDVPFSKALLCSLVVCLCVMPISSCLSFIQNHVGSPSLAFTTHVFPSAFYKYLSPFCTLTVITHSFMSWRLSLPCSFCCPLLYSPVKYFSLLWNEIAIMITTTRIIITIIIK